MSLRKFNVRVSGVPYRQDAIQLCNFGNPVEFERDEGNPYDARAIAAYVDKRHIGFLPKDGWLTGFLLDQSGWAAGQIASIGGAPGGDLDIVLSIQKGQ